MLSRGDIVLARFPFTDGSGAKVRPVLVLASVPGRHDDYLVLFISSQLRIAVFGGDVWIRVHAEPAALALVEVVRVRVLDRPQTAHVDVADALAPSKEVGDLEVFPHLGVRGHRHDRRD